MKIEVGFEIELRFAEPTPVLLMMQLHPSRDATVLTPECLTIEPQVPLHFFTDSFGNRCGRTVVGAGSTTFRNRAVVQDCGLPDIQNLGATQSLVQDIPDSMLTYLLSSRYCEVDSELKDLHGSFLVGLSGLGSSPSGMRVRASPHSI